MASEARAMNQFTGGERMTDERTPRDHALGVIREAIDRDPALFVALAYCGMLKDDALAPLRDDDARLIERILSVPPAPSPVYERAPRADAPRRRESVRVLSPSCVPPIGGSGGSRVGGTRGSLFAQWIEGEVSWSPAVMGWADDDARAEGFDG